MKDRTSYYMADFAASDHRSVQAHLAGTSFRAMAYVVFAALAAVVGRTTSAPDDFYEVSRFLWKRRDKFKAFRDVTCRVLSAVVGLVAGVALYYLLEQ